MSHNNMVINNNIYKTFINYSYYKIFLLLLTNNFVYAILLFVPLGSHLDYILIRLQNESSKTTVLYML